MKIGTNLLGRIRSCLQIKRQMKTLMRLLFFWSSLLLCFSVSAKNKTRKPTSAFQCGSGSIRILISGDEKELKRRICSNAERTIFASENCIHGDCAVLKKFLEADFSDYKFFSTYSNPGFKLCEELGLKASIVTYILGTDEKISSDICEDPTDKSFINTSVLMSRLLERKK